MARRKTRIQPVCADKAFDADVCIDMHVEAIALYRWSRRMTRCASALTLSGAGEQTFCIAHRLGEARQRIIFVLLILEGNKVGILDFEQGVENRLQIEHASPRFLRYVLRPDGGD